MPWTNEIDPTKPADSDPAAMGDDEFRQLKSALEERLASRMPGWPTAQPLPILGVDVGALASRPATPAGDGHVYISDDPLPKRLYYGKGGAWQELTAESTIANFVTRIAGNQNSESIPISTSHLVTIPLAIDATQEIIGWRYRWKWPALSSSWVGWITTDSHASHGVPEGPGDYSGLVQLLRFDIDWLGGNLLFYFKNTDGAAHDVDLEWVVTLLKVG